MEDDILVPPTPPDFSGEVLDEEGFLQNSEEVLSEEEFTENIHRTNFTLKQKMILILIGFFSFLIFSIIIFPYEEVVRKVLSKLSVENQIVIDFQNLNLPFFGSKTIDGLIYQGKDNSEIQAETIELDSSLFNLMSQVFKGDLEVTAVKLDIADIALSFKTVKIEDSFLDSFDKPYGQMSFFIKFNSIGGKIRKSMVIPFVDINLKDIQIKSLSFEAKKDKSGTKVKIEKFFLNTNIAKVILDGTVELSEFIKNSQLNLKICPTLDEKFKAEREDVAGNLQLMMKNEKCFTLEGSIGAPKPNLPGLKELMGGTNVNQSQSMSPKTSEETPAVPPPQP